MYIMAGDRKMDGDRNLLLQYICSHYLLSVTTVLTVKQNTFIYFFIFYFIFKKQKQNGINRTQKIKPKEFSNNFRKLTVRLITLSEDITLQR